MDHGGNKIYKLGGKNEALLIKMERISNVGFLVLILYWSCVRYYLWGKLGPPSTFLTLPMNL